MALFKIEHRITGKVLFELECGSLKICVEAAVSDRANLSRAYLVGAYLTGANLTGANLTGANLSRANLTGANLDGANLEGANLAGANLARAYLVGAYLDSANLDGANLDGKLKPATAEESIANLDKVREIILDSKDRLDMGHWHGADGWQERTCAEEAVCGTTHCLAGWLQVCSTEPEVKKLEAHIAGYICAPVAAKMFYKDNAETMKWLRERTYATEAK